MMLHFVFSVGDLGLIDHDVLKRKLSTADVNARGQLWIHCSSRIGRVGRCFGNRAQDFEFQAD